MEPIERVHGDQEELFNQIGSLKKDLNKIYTQKGPASSDYISLSIQLNLLIQQYFGVKN